jgi:hypothetical protein
MLESARSSTRLDDLLRTQVFDAISCWSTTM